MSAARYGVGAMTNTITHRGDDLEIVTQCAGRTHVVKIRLDGTALEHLDPVDAAPVMVAAVWEKGVDQVIRLTGHYMKTGRAMPIVRRFMLGSEMCVEQTSPAGRVVTRFFAQR